MIGERFNMDDVFFRDLTVCVLDTLEGEVKWVNRFTSGEREVEVPFYYSLTGDGRFAMDSFNDDIVSNNRFVELNTDKIPRGHLTLTSFDIRSDEFANPNVWLKMVLENKDEIKKFLTKIRAVPVSVRYDLSILLSSEIDVFKCSQVIMDTLWLYRYMYFEHNFMNIDAIMIVPDNNSVEISREKNLNSDNTIKINVQFEVQTYYPAYRKPKSETDQLDPKKQNWDGVYNYDPYTRPENDNIIYPKKTKWYANLRSSTTQGGALPKNENTDDKIGGK